MTQRDRPSSLHLVDDELLPLLDAVPHFAIADDTLDAFRSWAPPQPPQSDAAKDVAVVYRHIDGPSGAPPVRIGVYRPGRASGALPTILQIHGGGFVSGTLEAWEGRYCELAALLQCAVVAVDYRLAPETRFPGAIEDCYAVLGWISRSGAEIGASTSNIALKGESAGGGLAAALALLSRDRGEYKPVFQHLTYPMLDDRTGTVGEAHPFAGQFIWTAADNRYGWSALLGAEPGSAGLSCYASPTRASDLSGLPPAYIMTGALDLFAEEGIAYAQRLIRSGVPVELHVFPGGFHGFDLVPSARISQAARQTGYAALSHALGIVSGAP